MNELYPNELYPDEREQRAEGEHQSVSDLLINATAAGVITEEDRGVILNILGQNASVMATRVAEIRRQLSAATNDFRHLAALQEAGIITTDRVAAIRALPHAQRTIAITRLLADRTTRNTIVA